MSARVTGDEALRWALRLFSRRSLWPLAPGSPSETRLSLVWKSSQRSSPLAGVPPASVRFYSSQDPEAKKLLLVRPVHSASLEPTASPSLLPPRDQAVLAEAVSFFDLLKDCASPTEVLDLVARSEPAPGHVSSCLTRIWEVAKRMTEEQRRYELSLVFQHAAFKGLLQRVTQEAARMRTADLTYCLVATVKLGVGQRSRVVQTLLRVCQERLNEFDEKELSVLASSLNHMERSANVEALNEGIRLLVATQLPSIQKVMTLQVMMRLLGRDAPLDLKKKLERKALSMADQVTLPDSKYMISTMATMNFYSKPLLNIYSAMIAENVHSMPFHGLLTVLRSYKDLRYRHLGLLTAVSEHMASSMDLWNNKQVILLLSVFEDLVYCPAALMEAFSQRVIHNMDPLSPKDVLSVLKSYSSLNYDLKGQRQEFLDTVTRALQSYLAQMSPWEVLKAVHCLCLLGHFPASPLEHLLSSPSLEELGAGDQAVRSTQRRLWTVDACLRLDRPPLPRPLSVPASALSVLGHGSTEANPALTDALEHVLEGGLQGTLERGVMVENQYLIDGVVSRPTAGSFPADGQPAQTEHSQRIAVICPSPSSFCYGTSHPRGNLPVRIRHLKILGYHPIVVAQHELKPLSEAERCALLRARIFPELPSSEIPEPEAE